MAKVKLTPAKESKKAIKLTPGEPAVESDNPVLDTALDSAYAATQGATFNFADEAYGAGRALLEMGGGNKKEFGDIYPQHRDNARAQWDLARERSPIATTISEVGGAVVSPVNKIFGPVKGLKGILRGAAEGGLQGYGATEKEDLLDQAVDSGMGAGIGAVTGVVSNAITKRYSKSPEAMRSEVLGVKPKDYRVDGPGDRKKIVERINETGMLKNRKMEYDVDQMKFVGRNKSKFQLDELEKNTEDRLLSRAEDAIEKLQQRKEQHYGKLLDNRYVPAGKVDEMVNEIADEYRKRGLIKGAGARNEAVQKIRENIYDSLMMNEGADLSKFSLRQLDQLKRMAQEDVKNFSKGLGELGDNDELARITARKLKNLVETNIGDEGFKKINSAQHDFLSVSGDLKNKIKSMELAAPERIQAEKTNFMERFIDSAQGGSHGRLDNAARKEWYQNNVPASARAVIPYALEETPGALYRQRLLGTEQQVEVIENDPGHPMNNRGRMPQSVPNIPEQFIRTPLPRSTQELQKNRNFVLGKVAQMMPEMFEAVKDTYDHEPERLGEVAQVLAMKMPHLFERDKYNRFDGRILSEADKQKAIKDTLLRQDISSIDQAKIITRLNKEGLYDG